MIVGMPGFYLIDGAGMPAIAARPERYRLGCFDDRAPGDLFGPFSCRSHGSFPGNYRNRGDHFKRHRSHAGGRSFAPPQLPLVFSLSLIALAASLIFVFAIKAVPLSQVRQGQANRACCRVPDADSSCYRSNAHRSWRGSRDSPELHRPFGADLGFNRVGPFFLAFSTAAVLTRLGIGDISDRYGRKRVIIPSALLISINLLWIAGIHSYWAFVLSGFLAGLGQGLIFPALSTYVIDFLGRENKGLALGLYLSLFDVGMGLGSPLFGWISDAAGYRTMYVVAGCLSIVLTILFSIKAPVFPMQGHAGEVLDN